MRFPFVLAIGMAGILALASATRADAANPVHYTDSAAFHALGAIQQLTDFDALYPGADTMFLDDVFVDGDISITGPSENSLIAKGSAPYFAVRNSFANNNNTIAGDITAPGYDMITFWIGDLLGSDAVTITFTLNDGFYGTGVMSWPAQEGFRFHGFVAPQGKYFTSFGVLGNDTNGLHRIGLAQIELGKTGAVPEPATWGLMIFGLGAVGVMFRRRALVSAPV
ncbi:PEPxxWA-CTERM sorting domain-containing protein [Phenylobacterium sp.]|uniref:PEPxxWA-CTERM sorting domain-containing protein n=1 Tax=Phenylobacterium sp. TaxID=1871053 RepID=UPI003D2D81EB